MENKKFYLPARFVLVFLLLWAVFLSYTFRTNLSLTMVAMVNQSSYESSTGNATTNGSAARSTGQCAYDGEDNSTMEQISEGQFSWNFKTQSFLQGGFFYGYASTQILSGWMSSRFGAKYLVGGGMLLGSICTLLNPVLAQMGPAYLMAVRVITGISQSVLYPCITTLLLKWIPTSERSRMYTIADSGASLGILISMPIVGWLCLHGFAGGWPSVFYVFGSCGIVWVVIWFVLAHESPQDHPRISLEERKMILDSLPRITFRPVPWLSLLTSAPVWAYMFALGTVNWIYYTRITELPSYLNSVLKLPIQKNAIVNSMVTAAGVVAAYIFAFVTDAVLSRKLISRNKIRKLMEIIGQTGAAACLVGVNLSGCNTTMVIAFLMLSAAVLNASNCGVGVTAMEMSPTFSGTVYGMGNTVASITGFVSPLLTGLIVTGESLFDEWHYVFYVSAGVGVLGSCVFLIFGTTDAQKWNFETDEHAEDDQEAVLRKFSVQ